MLLTIAIPHSHDIDALITTLEWLKAQQHEDVEIMVNDNASGQEFSDVMARMSHQIASLVYYENSVFQSFDENLEKCIRQSRGDFVWLLGVGDTIPIGHINLAIQLIQKHPKAVNILANVQVSKKEDFDQDKARQSASLPLVYENSLGAFPLDSLYNSALSGNLVNRLSWLKAMEAKLEYENWGHVERTLHMYCNSGMDGYGIRSQELSVFVDRPQFGWWNENDIQFFYNHFTHFKILRRYASKPELVKYKKARLLRNVNFSLIKAYLYGKTINKRGPAELYQRVNQETRSLPTIWLFIKLFNLMPKQLIASSYMLVKRIKMLFG